MTTKKSGSPTSIGLALDLAHPVVLVQDKFDGAYSKGLWIAIAMADAPVSPLDIDRTRAAFILEEGPNGTDEEALKFWTSPPDWVAAGQTPETAIYALLQNA